MKSGGHMEVAITFSISNQKVEFIFEIGLNYRLFSLVSGKTLINLIVYECSCDKYTYKPLTLTLYIINHFDAAITIVRYYIRYFVCC